MLINGIISKRLENFQKSKLNLLNDKVLPVEKVSYNKALKNKITVNYSAILQNHNEYFCR